MEKAIAQQMGRAEFVALIAMLFATIAFSVDALLPVFPLIEEDLGTNAHGRAHLLITIFMAGLAFGTLFAGPVSDSIGRKPTMFVGAILYIGSGVVAWLSQSFEIIVFARLIQGVGAAGPRVVSLAIVRDLYKGRHMAQIMSYALVIFTIVPTLAPAMGDIMGDLFGWRSILLSFVIFSCLSTLWFWQRLTETHPVEARRPFRFDKMKQAALEIAQHRVVRLAIVVQSVALALIFCLLVSVQPIYQDVFGRADNFAYWFGGIALVSAATTSLANALLVMKFGMQRLVTFAMLGQCVSATITLIGLMFFPQNAFGIFVMFQFMLIWLTGLSIGNLNAIAMEPMGHIAGLAASITGAISTILAAFISSFVGFVYNGTPYPLIIAALALATLGLVAMLRMNAHSPPN